MLPNNPPLWHLATQPPHPPRPHGRLRSPGVRARSRRTSPCPWLRTMHAPQPATCMGFPTSCVEHNELKMGTYKMNHSNMNWSGINHDQSINKFNYISRFYLYIYCKNRLRSKGRKKIAPLAAKTSRSLKMNTLAMAIPTFLLREYSKGGCLDSCTMANKVDPLPQNAKGGWRIRVDFPPHMLGWQVIPSTTSMSGTWKGFTVMSPFMFQKIHSMKV